MNVFVLKVKPHLLEPSGADAVGYSEWSMARGFVVLAEDEAEAREVATASHDPDGGSWWRDESSTTCELVPVKGRARVIMANEPTG